MSGADWLMVGAIALSVLMAAAQGFFFEIFSLAGVVLGYLLAAWEYPQLAPRFLPFVNAAWVAEFASFLTIFFVVLLAAGMAGRIARWAMKEAGLRWVDRLLGAAFGLLRGVVLVTVVLVGLTMFAPGSRVLRESRLAGYFLVAGRAMSWVAPAAAREKFRSGIAALRQQPQAPAPAEPARPAQKDR